MRRRIPLRAALVPLTLLFGLALSSVPAVAATPAGGGLMESFTFKDTMDHPGVTCYYPGVSHADNDLKRLVVGGPRLYARDRTSGVDHQTVAWRFIIKGAKAGHPPYTNRYKSSWKTATADDSSGHKFGPGTWVQPRPTENRQWVAHLELRWYKPGSSTTVEQTIRLTDQWQRSVYPPNPDMINPAPCQPGM